MRSIRNQTLVIALCGWIVTTSIAAAQQPDGPAVQQPSQLSPLAEVPILMRQASKRLATGQADAETRELQRLALQRLDELLQKLGDSQPESEPQAEQSASKSKALQPGDPARSQDAAEPKQGEGEQGSKQDAGAQNGSPAGGKRSGAASGNTPASNLGPGGAVRIAPKPNEALSQGVWGHLPDRMRRDLDAISSEQYLPKYRKLIEDYYRRLSEMKRDAIPLSNK